MRVVVVAGASGFVGGRLCPALENAGHTVRAMTRNPDNYDGAGVRGHGGRRRGAADRLPRRPREDADDLSPHLRSRREVEELLGSGGVPVTTLRAGIIVGHGGISWEITRQLVETCRP